MVKMRYGGSGDPTKTDVYRDSYYGSHAIRAVGMATSTTSISVLIPLLNPDGETPSVSDISASVTGIGSVTASLDSTRTNKDAVAFTLTSSGLTNHYAYLCLVSFTLS